MRCEGRHDRPHARRLRRLLRDSQRDEGALPGESIMSILAQEDMRRLTLFKWQYSLESQGFTIEESRRLLFLRWLFMQADRHRPGATCTDDSCDICHPHQED